MSVLATIAIALSACASAARADVLQIGDDGAVAVRTGGGNVQWSGDADVAVTAADMPIPSGAAGAGASAVPAAWRPALEAAAGRERLSPDLLAALIAQESGWRPRAVSDKGAIGLTQLMPATARGLAVDPRDPASNIAGGAHYLRQLLDRFDGDIERALAAYNAGPGRVLRAGGVPRIAETQAYVTRIIDRLTPVSMTGRP